MENKELETKRHSCAHIMAQAVQQLFPGTKLGIGPAIENGFYYDFDCPKQFTPEDLKAIETKMKEIINSGATTILVSHSIVQVRDMCNKVLWLHKGNQIEFGADVNGICDRYQEFLNGKRTI